MFAKMAHLISCFLFPFQRRIHYSKPHISSTTEEEIYHEVLSLVSINQPKPFPSDGIVLGSKLYQITLDGLNTNGTIFGVPLDLRDHCYHSLVECVNRAQTSQRLYLLCNAASRGSGKTVLQHFNMKWFVERTKGIAIEVTFNDDQTIMTEAEIDDTLSSSSFEVAVAVRILHRAIAY